MHIIGRGMLEVGRGTQSLYIYNMQLDRASRNTANIFTYYGNSSLAAEGSQAGQPAIPSAIIDRLQLAERSMADCMLDTRSGSLLVCRSFD